MASQRYLDSSILLELLMMFMMLGMEVYGWALVSRALFPGSPLVVEMPKKKNRQDGKTRWR